MIAILNGGKNDGVKMRVANDAYRIEVPIKTNQSDLLETETYAIYESELIGDEAVAQFVLIEA